MTSSITSHISSFFASLYINLLLRYLLLVSLRHYIKDLLNLGASREYLANPTLDNHRKARRHNGVPSLVTHAKSERDNMSQEGRIKQFRALIQENNVDSKSPEELINFLNTNIAGRRLSSLLVSQIPFNSTLLPPPLLTTLVTIYPTHITAPPLPPLKLKTLITLVVTTYNEKPSEVSEVCNLNMMNASKNRNVELIIVNCGGEDMTKEVKVMKDLFGDSGVRYIKSEVYGRGQGLNVGGREARGDVVTFCHADTSLPVNWDVRVRETLNEEGVEAMAFMFQMSNVGDITGGSGVTTCVDIRCRLFNLPYGDQTLSMRKGTFDWIGGYPNQCLMEDYEIITFLRKRTMLGLGKLKVLTGGPNVMAICSNRRWAKNGVRYVCTKNAEVVKEYHNFGAKQCYEKYYGRTWEGTEGREEEIDEAL